MRSGIIVLAALALVVSGCFQGKPGSPAPAQPKPDDGLTTLSILVVDAVTGAGLAKSAVEVRVPGIGTVSKTSNDDGRVNITIRPAPACSVHVEHAGYQGGAASLNCSKDQLLRLPLKPVAVVVGPGSKTSTTSLPPPAPGEFRVAGAVVDQLTGEPVKGASVALDGAPATRTTDGAAYAFNLPKGKHALVADAPCHLEGRFDLDLQKDTVLNLQLARDGAVPAAPTGLRAAGGPGPGMVAVAWLPVPGATGYTLLRGNPPAPIVQLANTLAYGVHGAVASDQFSVEARNDCGFASAPAGPVSAAPLPGTPASPMAANAVGFTANVQEADYPVVDETGAPAGERTWRTVMGTGNCCENYLTTTPDGRIVDVGAQTAYSSADAGRTWTRVAPTVPPPCGEGAVIAAPDGDVEAVDWIACIPIMDDQLLALKYSAATGQWFSQLIADHSPFYDRPWIGVVKGPFDIDGLIVPYLTFCIGGYPTKEVMLLSLDGLHFAVPSSSSLDAINKQVQLAALDLAPDSDRDWTQATVNAGIAALDHGLGLRYDLNLLGSTQLLKDGTSWGSTWLSDATIPAGALQADGRGGLHVVAMTSSSFTYSWSHDGGRTWDHLVQPILGGDATNWDFRAHAGLDEMALSVRVQKPDGNDQFLVYRYTGLDATPQLKEILTIGLGDHPFRGAVTGGGSRFDFMTVAFLPDGRLVTSFGDSKHGTPSLAIETEP